MNKIFIILFIALAAYGFIYHEHNRPGPENATSLTLTGDIDDNFHYKVAVQYIATKNKFWCKSHAFTPYTYTKPSRKTFEYLPIIEDGKHSINVILSEFAPDKGCRYQPIGASFSVAPDNFEALYKNSLLATTQYIADTVQVQSDISDYLQDNDLNMICFPVIQSARLADAPNKHWICKLDQKEQIAFSTDFRLNQNLDIAFNIRTISNEEYRQSCFHWAAHHKETCQ